MTESPAQAEHEASTAAPVIPDVAAGNLNESNIGEVLSSADASFLEEVEREVRKAQSSPTAPKTSTPQTAKSSETPAPKEGVQPPTVPGKLAETDKAGVQPPETAPASDPDDVPGELPRRVRIETWSDTDRKAAKLVREGLAPTLKDALKMLEPAAPAQAANPSVEQPTAEPVRTSEDAHAEVLSLEERYLKLADDIAEAKKNLESEEEAKLSKEKDQCLIDIRRKERERDDLAFAESKAQEEAINAHNQAIVDARHAACARFKDASDKDSRLAKEIGRIFAAWTKYADPRLDEPNAPLLLTEQAAENTGYDPETGKYASDPAPAPAVTPVTPPDTSKNGTPAAVKAPPHNPPLGSGHQTVLTPLAPQSEEIIAAVREYSPAELIELEKELVKLQSSKKAA